MNDMLGRLEASSTQQRQFVSDAGHELEDPVGHHPRHGRGHPVASRTRLGRGHRSGPRIRATARSARRRPPHALAQFDENAATGAAARRAVDLEDLVLTWASSTNVDDRINVDLTEVVAGRVHGDERELRRLVGNILDNAVQHVLLRGSRCRCARSRRRVPARAPWPARLRAAGAARDVGGGVVLTVDDDGPGVPADQRDAIFDRFARLDACRVPGPDGGHRPRVGHRAAACALRHGGSITVADSPLGGARFEVQPPRLTPSIRGTGRVGYWVVTLSAISSDSSTASSFISSSRSSRTAARAAGSRAVRSGG